MPKFLVEYRVTGRVTDYIEADSQEHAKSLVEAKLEASEDNDEPFLDLEEVTDIDYTISEMFSVIRDGQRISTTYIRATDERVRPPAYQPTADEIDGFKRSFYGIYDQYPTQVDIDNHFENVANRRTPDAP